MVYGLKPQNWASQTISNSSTLLAICASLWPNMGIVLRILRDSGHGYANLLYLATIAAKSEKASSADLTLFLSKNRKHIYIPSFRQQCSAFCKDKLRNETGAKIKGMGQLENCK